MTFPLKVQFEHELVHFRLPSSGTENKQTEFQPRLLVYQHDHCTLNCSHLLVHRISI